MTTNEYKSNVAADWDQYAQYNAKSTSAFLGFLPNLRGKSLLDIGCGNGTDMIMYRERGASYIVGMDSSTEMLHSLRERDLADEILHMDITSECLINNHFDVVVSKWALQCVNDYGVAMGNMAALLKSGGVLVILVVHPLRQFLKKERGRRNYFKQEVVESSLFDGQLIVNEPSHTFADLLSPTFFAHFDLVALEEGQEIGCSKVDGDSYPQYLLVKAVRR